ncbi:hypothetical protein GGU11DRAFT_758108 [Lentinula aff. detonsa]|nr:hypothetical protein GGU11DRAFT_758108 [Lentinula aff. detonsa]
MAVVCRLNQLSSKELGSIPNMHLGDFNYLRDRKQFAQDFKNKAEGLVGATYCFNRSDGCIRTFVIKRVSYRAEGMAGRGSIVACLGGHECMKISFPSRHQKTP